MNRKRIVANLAALSLLFSGLPAAPAYAAEIPETEIDMLQEEDTDQSQSETEAMAETTDASKSLEVAEESDTNEVKEHRASVNEKMAGSNGILYDDVAYLSTSNVFALDTEMQEVYCDLCDEIASNKESGLEMQDVVIAVDSEGDLYCSYYIPMRVLETMQEDFFPDMEEALSLTAEDTQEESKDGEISVSDNNIAEGETENEETPTDDDSGTSEEEEKIDEAPVDESNTADGESEDEEAPADDLDITDADQEDEEASDTDQDIEGENLDDVESLSDDTAIEEESYVLSEENMDRIVEPVEETFEITAPVRIQNTLDLGYGVTSSHNPGEVQLYSILPTENYFEAQLTSAQKKYYKAAKEKLTTGSTQFSFQAPLSARDVATSDVAHAVSALILAYPEQMDWIAKPGGFLGTIVFKEKSKTATYYFTFDLSKFYSKELNAQANNKVLEIANNALSYASDNYPDAPVYGIVKYYDQWLCEHGYYEKIGATDWPNTGEWEIYYNCHTPYGVLLNGYGVCESYSKAMARLLDAVGIPNVYAVGTAGNSGHTWNYIQMPDGKWYLQDSTWNDNEDPGHTVSDGKYFLKRGDGSHLPSGCNYTGESPDFKFPDLSTSDYSYEKFALTQSEYNLLPKEAVTLSPTRSVSGYWTSSNAKVAKVDKNGKVTAVAGGTAVVTFAGQGLTDSCVVNVDQIKAVKTAETKKTSETISLGITQTAKDSKDIMLAVDVGASPHTAEWMISQNKITAPQITSSKSDVATATATVIDNTITVHVQAVAAGTSNVTVKFGGKTVTIKASAGTLITKEMFDVTWPAGVTGEEGNKTVAYTGKVIKPVIKKKTDEVYKPVKFKISYINNKDAGIAKAVVTGTGAYGGTIEYPFTITPLDITNADFTKALKNKVYNGGDNPPAATVKLGKTTLKMNRDYEVLYTGEGFSKEKLSFVPAGSYTVTIRGIGNYVGEVKTTQSYQVTQNTVAKVSVAGASSVKHTGIVQNPYTVKIGKNVLPVSDYTITWYLGQGKTKRELPMATVPSAKGKYTAVITVRGNNLTTTAKKKEIEKKLTIK